MTVRTTQASRQPVASATARVETPLKWSSSSTPSELTANREGTTSTVQPPMRTCCPARGGDQAATPINVPAAGQSSSSQVPYR